MCLHYCYPSRFLYHTFQRNSASRVFCSLQGNPQQPSLYNSGQRYYFSKLQTILQFSTRFWEHFDLPIYSSAFTTTDIPGIGMLVYPSYAINRKGPGVIIASYNLTEQMASLSVLPEDEYVRYILDAMVEMHGDVAREQYTGKYRTICWDRYRHTAGGWADPSIGQQTLYMPSYFKTENNVSWSLFASS